MLEKLKELSKDAAIYGISTMVGRFLNFIFVPFFTNIFRPDEYGYVVLIYAYIAIFNIVFIYGLDSAYLKYASSKDIGDDKDNFSTPYIVLLITSVFFTSILILFHKSFASVIQIPEKFSYFIILGALIIFFDTISNIPFLKLRLLRKAMLFSFLKITNIFINLSLNFVLIFIYDFGIEAVFISNLVAAFVTFLLLTPTIIKNFRFNVNFNLLKRLLRFGLPYLPAGLALMFVQVIDVPIVEKLTNVETVGIYKANYKLGIFMMLYVNMFQYAWQPFFLNNAKVENIQEVFAKVLTYFSITGSIILIAISLFIEDIIKINFWGFHLLGEKYWDGIPIIPIILLAYLFNGLYVVFSAGIYIKEKSIFAPIVAGAGAIVNVIANYILVPQLNIFGAALATLFSYIIMALGYYLVTQKYYKINYEYSKVIKLFIGISIVALIYYAFLVDNQNVLFWKILIFISFLFFIFVQILDKKELDFLKNKFLK